MILVRMPGWGLIVGVTVFISPRWRVRSSSERTVFSETIWYWKLEISLKFSMVKARLFSFFASAKESVHHDFSKFGSSSRLFCQNRKSALTAKRTQKIPTSCFSEKWMFIWFGNKCGYPGRYRRGRSETISQTVWHRILGWRRHTVYWFQCSIFEPVRYWGQRSWGVYTVRDSDCLGSVWRTRAKADSRSHGGKRVSSRHLQQCSCGPWERYQWEWPALRGSVKRRRSVGQGVICFQGGVLGCCRMIRSR